MSEARDGTEPLADARDRHRAMHELGTSFAVEAAAGAGKTTVLVTRLLHLLSTGTAALREIVAITFTEKAAGELKMRIRERLEAGLDALGGGEEETARRFRQALDDLGHAPIGTIHSFCASLLRERPVEAGVDPQFQVVDELEASLLRERVWRDWLEAELAAGRPALLRAVACGLSLEGDGHTLYGLAMAMLECRDLLEGRPRPAATPGVRDFIAHARAKLAVLVDQLDTYCEGETAAKFRTYMEDARRTLILAHGLSDAQAEAVVLRLNLRRRFPAKKSFSRSESYSLASGLHEELKERLDALQPALGADLATAIAEALAGFADACRRAKDAEGLLDFQDLLLLTRDLLGRSREARDHFKERCRFLLVDEFQDTDPLQVEIVFFLAERRDRHATSWDEVEVEEGKLFIVGDPKQSIYRFRRADIEVYEKAKQALCRHGDPLILSQSFRPLRSLADVVNRVFAPVIRKPDDGAYQPDYVPLRPRRPGDLGGHSVELLYPAPGTGEGLESQDDYRAAEARCAAAMIRKMVDEKWEVFDPKAEMRRPVGYGDIAVLARTFAAADLYADALAAAHVPLRIVGGKHFYLTPEVAALVAVLKALDNPHDRLSLVAALRGPFFGVSDDELLVATCEHGPLSYLGEGYAGALGAAMAVLRERHERRNAEPLALFLQRLYERMKALELSALRQRGAQRVANLLKIVERARALEATQRVSFRGFVRWLSRLHETQADEAESPLMGGERDFVQFLTIHRAKGLEFPVVFVADLAASDRRGTNFVVLRDRSPAEGQFAFYLGAKDLGIRTPNWPGDDYDAVRSAAEAARLFYVATTRARDRLFLLLGWGQSAAGFMRFLPDELATEEPPWGETTLWGHVFDTASLRLGADEPGPFLVSWPTEEGSATAAADRLAARKAWREETNGLLATAREGIAWRTPSRLAAGLAAEPADEEQAAPQPAGAAPGEARGVGLLVHRGLEWAGRWKGAREASEVAEASDVWRMLDAEALRLGLTPAARDEARRLVRVALGSDLWRRASAAPARYHEVPFSVLLGGRIGGVDEWMNGQAEARMDLQSCNHPPIHSSNHPIGFGNRQSAIGNPQVILTGFMDLLFVEDDGAVVVDFKTDAVRDAEDIERRAATYRSQVLAYALAAERTLCKPVKEVILCFLAAGQEWRLAVTPEVLREAEACVLAGERLAANAE